VAREATPKQAARRERVPRGERKRRGVFGWIGWLVRTAALVVLAYLLACTLLLVAYRWADPPVTGVQLQRLAEAALDGEAPTLRYHPVGADAMAAAVRHAAVASEDGRFYTHKGFDWEEIRRAREEAARRGRPPRGASTITQQLVKNLFLTTHRSWIRKGFEVPLTFLAELILPKERILTLYLNVAEWGPDRVFGIEAAAQYHYGISAAELSRDRAARLVAILPNPVERDPRSMGGTASRIQRRMRQMGW